MRYLNTVSLIIILMTFSACKGSGDNNNLDYNFMNTPQSETICLEGETLIDQTCMDIVCDTGKHNDGVSCVSDTRQVLCSGAIIPDSIITKWNNVIKPGYYEQKYVDGEWQADKNAFLAPPGDTRDCSYSCVDGYIMDLISNSCR